MMLIRTEEFSASLYEEILPLGRKCWAESTEFKGETCAYYGERDFEIQPDFDLYQRLADSNSMLVFTLRHDEVLVGYAVLFFYNSWHHKKILCANVDTMYVEPTYRVYAPIVIDRIERELPTRNVGIIAWPTHINGPMYDLLKKHGYIGDDIVMEKRVCA